MESSLKHASADRCLRCSSSLLSVHMPRLLLSLPPLLRQISLRTSSSWSNSLISSSNLRLRLLLAFLCPLPSQEPRRRVRTYFNPSVSCKLKVPIRYAACGYGAHERRAQVCGLARRHLAWLFPERSEVMFPMRCFAASTRSCTAGPSPEKRSSSVIQVRMFGFPEYVSLTIQQCDVLHSRSRRGHTWILRCCTSERTAHSSSNCADRPTSASSS